MEEKEQQKENIIKIIDGISGTLNFTVEDKKAIRVMVDAYFRKRTGITTSGDEITAAAFLWQYSKINFLWEHDKSLMKKNIANMLNVSPNTVGNKSSEISKSLKIDFFDERFCRKEVSDQNPFKQFAMTPQGFIINKKMIEKKDKEDAGEDDGIWEKGFFSETLSSQDAKEKMKTFHAGHEEDTNFNCKKCNKKISAHNKDWHDGMCDKCFNNAYFPEAEQEEIAGKNTNLNKFISND